MDSDPFIKQKQEDSKSEEEIQKVRKLQTDTERKLLIAESNLVWSV